MRKKRIHLTDLRITKILRKLSWLKITTTKRDDREKKKVKTEIKNNKEKKIIQTLSKREGKN